VKGEFVPRRERDELSLALCNKEHPGQVWGFSSKYGLKLGFLNQLAMYKTRQHYKDDLLAQLCKKADQYIDEKLNQRLQASQDQGSVEPSALVALTSVASTTLETFPVDAIDSRTPCALHIPYNMKGKTIKFASGTAYPGCILHHSVVLEDYARVEVKSVIQQHLDFEVDIPAPDGTTLFGELEGSFIAWQRQDIELLRPLPLAAPCTSSRHDQFAEVELVQEGMPPWSMNISSSHRHMCRIFLLIINWLR